MSPVEFFFLHLPYLPERGDLVDAVRLLELCPDDVGVGEHGGRHGAERDDAQDGEEDDVDGALAQRRAHDHLALLAGLHVSRVPQAWGGKEGGEGMERTGIKMLKPKKYVTCTFITLPS